MAVNYFKEYNELAKSLEAKPIKIRLSIEISIKSTKKTKIGAIVDCQKQSYFTKTGEDDRRGKKFSYQYFIHAHAPRKPQGRAASSGGQPTPQFAVSAPDSGFSSDNPAGHQLADVKKSNPDSRTTR
jgi:hypothetical protein